MVLELQQANLSQNLHTLTTRVPELTGLIIKSALSIHSVPFEMEGTHIGHLTALASTSSSTIIERGATVVIHVVQ